MTTSAWSVRRVHALDDAQIDELASVLIDCVEGGASVSFMHPLSRERAVAFWRGVAHGVAAGERGLRVHQQVWVLEGAIDVTVGKEQHRLREGDCLAMQLDRPTMFHNPTRRPTRYAVVIASETTSRR